MDFISSLFSLLSVCDCLSSLILGSPFYFSSGLLPTPAVVEDKAYAGYDWSAGKAYVAAGKNTEIETGGGGGELTEVAKCTHHLSPSLSHLTMLCASMLSLCIPVQL